MKIQAPLFPVLACLLLPCLTGCDEPQVAKATSKEPEAPNVGIVTLAPQSRPYIRELPGRIAPTRIAEVRARIPGIIVERTFRQGTDVKAGDVLYRVDPTLFKVELDAANAALSKAEAVLAQADQQGARAEKLFSDHAMSQATYEAAIATRRQAEADVAARKADVARAKINLDHTTVRSPIDGRAGRAMVTEGALVGQGDATHLVTVQQLDPIYADFTQSVTEMQRLRREFESGELEQVAPDAVKVKLVMEDGTIYPHTGRLLFSGASVDPGTGQVTLRGEFPNPKMELLPGMYVRVQIEQGVDGDALAVPQQAVRRGDDGASRIFILRADNRVVSQPVKTGPVVEGQWIIQEGAKPGDRVIVEGFQKFVPGDVVAPEPWKHGLPTATVLPSDVTSRTEPAR